MVMYEAVCCFIFTYKGFINIKSTDPYGEREREITV